MKNKLKITLPLAFSASILTPLISASCLHKLDNTYHGAKQLVDANPIQKLDGRKIINDRVLELRKLARESQKESDRLKQLYLEKKTIADHLANLTNANNAEYKSFDHISKKRLAEINEAWKFIEEKANEIQKLNAWVAKNKEYALELTQMSDISDDFSYYLLSNLKAQKQSLISKNKSEISAIESQISASQSDLQKLADHNAKIAKLQSEIDSLNKLIQEKRNEVTTSIDSIKDAPEGSESTDWEKWIEELRSYKINILTKQMNELKYIISQNESKISNLKNKISESKLDINANDEHISKLNKLIETYNLEIQNLSNSSDPEANKDEIEKIKGYITSVQNYIKIIQDINEANKKTYGETIDNSSEINSKIDNLSKEADKLEKEIIELEAKQNQIPEIAERRIKIKSILRKISYSDPSYEMISHSNEAEIQKEIKEYEQLLAKYQEWHNKLKAQNEKESVLKEVEEHIKKIQKAIEDTKTENSYEFKTLTAEEKEKLLSEVKNIKKEINEISKNNGIDPENIIVKTYLHESLVEKMFMYPVYMIRLLEEKNTELQKTLNNRDYSLITNIKELENNKLAKEKELKSVSEDLDSIKAKADQSQDIINKANESLNEIKQKNENLDKEIAEIDEIKKIVDKYDVSSLSPEKLEEIKKINLLNSIDYSPFASLIERESKNIKNNETRMEEVNKLIDQNNGKTKAAEDKIANWIHYISSNEYVQAYKKYKELHNSYLKLEELQKIQQRKDDLAEFENEIQIIDSSLRDELSTKAQEYKKILTQLEQAKSALTPEQKTLDDLNSAIKAKIEQKKQKHAEFIATTEKINQLISNKESLNDEEVKKLLPDNYVVNVEDDEKIQNVILEIHRERHKLFEADVQSLDQEITKNQASFNEKTKQVEDIKNSIAKFEKEIESTPVEVKSRYSFIKEILNPLFEDRQININYYYKELAKDLGIEINEIEKLELLERNKELNKQINEKLQKDISDLNILIDKLANEVASEFVSIHLIDKFNQQRDKVAKLTDEISKNQGNQELVKKLTAELEKEKKNYEDSKIELIKGFSDSDMVKTFGSYVEGVIENIEITKESDKNTLTNLAEENQKLKHEIEKIQKEISAEQKRIQKLQENQAEIYKIKYIVHMNEIESAKKISEIVSKHKDVDLVTSKALESKKEEEFHKETLVDIQKEADELKKKSEEKQVEADNFNKRAENILSVADKLHYEISHAKYYTYYSDFTELQISFKNLSLLATEKINADDLRSILYSYYDGTPFLTYLLQIEDKFIKENSLFSSNLGEIIAVKNIYNKIDNYYLDTLKAYLNKLEDKSFNSVYKNTLQFLKDNSVKVNGKNFKKFGFLKGYQSALPILSFLQNKETSYSIDIKNPPLFNEKIVPGSDKWKEYIDDPVAFINNNSNLFADLSKIEDLTHKESYEEYINEMKDYGASLPQVAHLVQTLLFLTSEKRPIYLSARYVQVEENKYEIRFYLEVLKENADPNKLESYDVYDILGNLNINDKNAKVLSSPLSYSEISKISSLPASFNNLENITNYKDIDNHASLNEIKSFIDKINKGSKLLMLERDMIKEIN
ncbi:hypothetical protein [Mycoplasma tauri]|uniref:hypothetical protein n=1 Tax=Mycoplasma tauri TaxID=547987 RepID=UPI001CBE8BB9|nr:hypothetical protein [Mycoplasma tauri]MBZ4226956.1 hypothetical protein [Mycoplasma tauri]